MLPKRKFPTLKEKLFGGTVEKPKKVSNLAEDLREKPIIFAEDLKVEIKKKKTSKKK